MFVARRTMNPQADLARGWSAWNGQYEAHPFSLSDVDNALMSNDDDAVDNYNDENDCDVSENAEAAADFCREVLDINVQRCPVTELYAVRHHDGLSSYAVDADSVESAIEAAKTLKADWLTGGVTGLRPAAFHHVRDDIYVFECESTDSQMDS